MADKKCIVMLPTFNEAGNIKTIIEKILAHKDVSIIVVDDESTDGTADIVRQISEKTRRVDLISRGGRRGRGLAGIAGYRYSLAGGAELILEMDADMSHDPKYIPEIIDAMDGCDMVIGSRFVPGGADERASLMRRCVSVFAKGFISFVLGVKVSDPTSGYRCFSRTALSDILKRGIESETPFIVLESLCKIKDAGYNIKDIPIKFKPRAYEESKLKLSMLVDCFMDVIVYKLTGHPRRRRR